MDVYWDLDNLCPKSATAAVVFERVLAAGAAFGRVNHPVRAYANDQTLARLAEDGEWLEGVVEVTACARAAAIAAGETEWETTPWWLKLAAAAQASRRAVTSGVTWRECTP